MKMTKTVFVVACAWACAWTLGAAEPAPQEHYGKVAQRVAGMLPRYHVLQKPMGDALSCQAWTNLLQQYDYNRAVFLKEDLDRFASMRFRIDDALRAGDVSFGFEVNRVFLKRLEECVDLATNLVLGGTLDFSTKEQYLFKREKAAWPVDAAERADLWRRRMKNELLAMTLGKRLDQEEKARDEAKGKKRKAKPAATNDAPAEVAAPEKTPEENLVNRYRHYLQMAHTEIDEEAVLQRYMSAVAQAYDPHTDYMAPMRKEDFDMDMNLQLVGVGAVLSMCFEDGSLEIKEVMKGGPMDREGSIKAGCRIVGVGQGRGEVENTTWKPMRKTIRKIRGKKDTTVTLEVTDKTGESRRRVSLVRDVIKLEEQAATGRVETVVLDGVTNRLGYVRLPGFYGTMDKKPSEEGYRSCSLDVARCVAQFNRPGAETDGLVLDLRGNGGGSLKEAVMLTALFVRPSPVVQIRETRNLYVLPTFPDQPTLAYDKPLVVMIDRASASASEIVAGALQDLGRAVVVGDTQTHGKGTVQTVLPMGGEKFGSMKITTARFYRINGSSTQVKGVSSDIRLPSTLDGLDIGEDKLPNALPWSRVESARFQKVWNLYTHVPALAAASAARLANDAAWKDHLEAVRLVKESADREVTPLERNERLEQMRHDRKVRELEADGLDDEEDEEEETVSRRKKKEKKNDLVLKETFNILADLVRLTGGEGVPPQAENKLPAWLKALGE